MAAERFDNSVRRLILSVVSADQADAVVELIRGEFGGCQVYVPRCRPVDRADVASVVARDGVAAAVRKYGRSRQTIHRIIRSSS